MEVGSVKLKREGFVWMAHGLHHAHLHILKYLMIPQFLELKARLLLSLRPEKVPGLRPQPYNPLPSQEYMPICQSSSSLNGGEALAMWSAA